MTGQLVLTVLALSAYLTSCVSPTPDSKDPATRVREALSDQTQDKVATPAAKAAESPPDPSDPYHQLLDQMQNNKERPDRLLEKYQTLTRKERDEFRRKMQKLRDDFQREERKKRETFLSALNTERNRMMRTKMNRDRSKNFFEQQDRKRKDYFADEKDRRANFESEARAQSQDFDSRMRERAREFTEQHRIYSKRHQDASRNKPAGAATVPENNEALKEFDVLDSTPGTTLAPEDEE